MTIVVATLRATAAHDVGLVVAAAEFLVILVAV